MLNWLAHPLSLAADVSLLACAADIDARIWQQGTRIRCVHCLIESPRQTRRNATPNRGRNVQHRSAQHVAATHYSVFSCRRWLPPGARMEISERSDGSRVTRDPEPGWNAERGEVGRRRNDETTQGPTFKLHPCRNDYWSRQYIRGWWGMHLSREEVFSRPRSMCNSSVFLRRARRYRLCSIFFSL